MLGKIKWQKSNRHVAKAKLSPHSFKAFIISLFLLVASIQFAEPYTCPSSIPTSMNIIKETGTFENYESVILYGLVGGQISKSIYYIYHLSSLSNPNNNSAVRKVDVSGVESWASGVQFELNVKSLSVDANEQRVIFAVDGTSNYVVVVCLKTSDGQIDSQMEL